MIKQNQNKNWFFSEQAHIQFCGKFLAYGTTKLNLIKKNCMFSCLGETQRHDFQAETRQLLDIVAKTLYSEKEVCVEKQHSFT